MVLSLCTTMCLISALSYLVMAFGYGYIQTIAGRERYYVRYLDWLLTTPLILAELYILSGYGQFRFIPPLLSSSFWKDGEEDLDQSRGSILDFTNFDMFWTMVAIDWLMIVAGAIGSFVQRGKWTFWIFGTACFVTLMYLILVTLKNNQNRCQQGEDYRTHSAAVFDTVGWLVLVTWTFYPMV